MFVIDFKIVKINFIIFKITQKHNFNHSKLNLVFNFTLKCNFHIIKISFEGLKTCFSVILAILKSLPNMPLEVN